MIVLTFCNPLADDTSTVLSYIWSCRHENRVVCSGRTKELRCGTSMFNGEAEVICELIVSSGNRHSEPIEAKVIITEMKGLNITLQVENERVHDKEVVLAYLRGSLTDLTFLWEVENCLSYVNNFTKISECSQYLFDGNTREFVKLDISKMQLDTDQVRIKLSISNANEVMSMFFAIKIKKPPKSGDFLIAPRTGIAWDTNFRLEARGFDASNGQLSYEFIYFDLDLNEYVPLTMITGQTQIIANLPAGEVNNDSRLEVGVRVYSKEGAWTIKTRSVISKPPEDNIKLIDRYKQILNNVDPLNPTEIIKQIVSGTLMLTNKVSAEDIGNKKGRECNSHGILVGKVCLCYEGYNKRLDCSLSDNKLIEEAELAKSLLLTIKEIIDKEPSWLKNIILGQAVVNIAKQSDLLDNDDRILARNLLEAIISQGVIINSKDLAKAISSLLILSENNKAEEEFNQVKNLISLCLNMALTNSLKQNIELNTENFNARSIMTYPLPGPIEQIDILGLPFMRALFENITDYIVIDIVEYKVKVYGWAANALNIKSNVISVDIKNSNGKPLILKNLTIPTNITFKLDIDNLTTNDLTNMRCMSYDGSKFVVEGTRIVNIDLERGIAICSTTHLSEFVLMIPEEGNFIFDFHFSNHIPPYIVDDKYKLYKSSLFWFTISLSLVFCYLLLWGYCKGISEAELSLLMNHQHDYLEDGFTSKERHSNPEFDAKFSLDRQSQYLGGSPVESVSPEDSSEAKDNEVIDKEENAILANNEEVKAEKNMEEEDEERYDLVATSIDNPSAIAGRQKKFKKMKKCFRRKAVTCREPEELMVYEEENREQEPEIEPEIEPELMNEQISEPIPTNLTTEGIPKLFFVCFYVQH